MGDQITVAYSSYAAGNAPMRFGQDRGLFEAHGVDLVMNEYPRGGAAIRELEQGTADIAVTSGLPILRAADRGAQPLIVMSIENVNVFAIMARKGITSSEQLRGETVGISSPDDQDGIMMRRALLDWGLEPGVDVEMRMFEGGRGAIWQALVSGDIAAQAATIPEPVNARAVGIPVLRDFSQIHEPYQAGSLVVRRPWANEHRDALQRTLTAQLESIRAFGADLQAALPVLRECTRIDNEEVLRKVGGMFAEAMLHFEPEIEPLAAVLADVKRMTGEELDANVDEIVDPSFVAHLE